MIKIIVPISGGKDSQACLKLALLEYDKSEVMGLFCDTKFEHPLTYAHIKNISEMYGVEIVTINAGSVEEKIIKHKRFPSGTARFCTDQLKIIPSKKFYKKHAEENGGFQVWYGMRAGESHERASRYSDKLNTETYAPHDVISNYPKYLDKLGVSFRLPVLNLSTEDIFEILGGEQNPLYSHGFERVGCFPCIAGGDKSKERAFQFDETGRKHYAIVKALEPLTGHSIWRSKGGALRNNENQSDVFEGCAICAM